MQPKTTSPILVNAEGRPTVHHFLRAEPVQIVVTSELATGEIRLLGAAATAFVYQCAETGAERRWGCQ